MGLCNLRFSITILPDNLKFPKAVFNILPGLSGLVADSEDSLISAQLRVKEIGDVFDSDGERPRRVIRVTDGHVAASSGAGTEGASPISSLALGSRRGFFLFVVLVLEFHVLPTSVFQKGVALVQCGLSGQVRSHFSKGTQPIWSSRLASAL